jgi:glycosyltransferase involved in cell wall biosynthesis
MMLVRIGIDATNLRGGGGVTHLSELLAAGDPRQFQVKDVVVWGGAATLDALPDRPWLIKLRSLGTDGQLWRRALWQRYRLSAEARRMACDVLFVPGGSFLGDFRPVVAMSQNLLPFDQVERRRYSPSLFALKLCALRWVQSRTFHQVDGLVFPSQHSRDTVLAHVGHLAAQQRVIPHGVHQRFTAMASLRPQPGAEPASPMRVLYLATIDHYKHQWHVVEAVDALRREGMNVELDLVGHAFPAAMKRLTTTIERLDADRQWVRYHGLVPYGDLEAVYGRTHVAVCASTCESFGLTLLESLAAGVPLACSGKAPMMDLVGESAVYFDPERPQDIARALREILSSRSLQTKLTSEGLRRASEFTWQRCASDTFQFLVELAQNRHTQPDVPR